MVANMLAGPPAKLGGPASIPESTVFPKSLAGKDIA
jgi:hypothetical protein